LEGCFWVIRLTRKRKPKGTTAWRKSGKHPKTLKVLSRKTRVIRRKLDCLNPNLQRCKGTLPATASTSRAFLEPNDAQLRSATSAGRAMGSEPIEGDEWDAYLTLATFSTNGTRDGLPDASPMVTESS
jgi:hypothetical protein